MTEAEKPPQGWDQGWEGHARAQRLRRARVPLWVWIDWLEETQRLLARLRRLDPPPARTPR